ncbi:MAG TPA: DnaJ domain-containing protein [Planctomycetota bacterium]|nr:DnaJ domain-containing protein [Planctomycetota bacterium]
MLQSPQALFHYYAARFLIGFAILIVAALGTFSRLLGTASHWADFWVYDLAIGSVGFWIALGTVTPLVRLGTDKAFLQRTAGRAVFMEFERADLPRRVFLLLLAVAHADGPLGSAERTAVQHFLRLRFPYADPRTFEVAPLEAPDVAALAARIALGLGSGERASLFTWCCLVAFADGTFRPQEHDVLQQVARGLGLPGQHARALFHAARERVLRGGIFGSGRRTRGPAANPAPRSERDQAYATLGLEPGADRSAIKHRHRELVKQYHPDAQPNLGPVAQEEATERFRAIQRAYELLTAP